MDRPVHRVIFSEAGHALRLGSNETKAKLCVFQRCVPAERVPLLLDDATVKFGYFTKRDLDLFDVCCMCMLEQLIEDNFYGLLVTHRMNKLYDMRFTLPMADSN